MVRAGERREFAAPLRELCGGDAGAPRLAGAGLTGRTTAANAHRSSLQGVTLDAEQRRRDLATARGLTERKRK